MKKFMFILMVAFVSGISKSYAQSMLVATLTHGDEITMFYGVYALQQAHAAAADGDIINLSGGAFNSVEITKALTIRGTGVLDPLPTSIKGDFDIRIPTTATERLSIEGCKVSNRITVCGTLSNAYFLKDDINGLIVYNASGNNLINGTFVNCNADAIQIRNSSTAQFINSKVWDFCNYSETTASASFINCVVHNWRGNVGSLRSVQLINCILFNDDSYNSYTSMPSTSSAWNCVAVGKGNESVFNNLSVKQNCTFAGIDIFKDGNGYNDLTDEAKAMYLGTDGTPVGMYGGVMPFNQIPTYPRITKMNVANKTTADGKLSVEIEVSATE